MSAKNVVLQDSQVLQKYKLGGFHMTYVYEARTWSAVILGRTGRCVASVAAQGAVGAGTGGPPLTG